MRERNNLGGTLLVETVTTVSAMVLSVRKGEGCPASHTHVGIGPFGGLKHYQLATKAMFGDSPYRAAVNHAAGH